MFCACARVIKKVGRAFSPAERGLLNLGEKSNQPTNRPNRPIHQNKKEHDDIEREKGVVAGQAGKNVRQAR